jgi:hypothetical protein
MRFIIDMDARNRVPVEYGRTYGTILSRAL